MAADAQVTQLQWDEQACALMQASAQASPWASVENFADNLARAHLLRIELGAQRALVALRGVQLQGGRLLEVAGLRSLGDRIRPDGIEVLQRVARDVYEADLLSLTTRHAHVARACVRAGWEPAYTMVKPLRP